MTVLSERDLKKFLGKDLIVYPFRGKESFRANKLCLTASQFVYSISQNQLLQIERHLDGYDFVQLPAEDTVLVWTNEALVLSKNLFGSVHSRVALVSQGIGHLGTTINPSWQGILCIALHNHSKKPVIIKVSKSEYESGETIAYIVFYKLSSASRSPYNLDNPGQLDVIPGSNKPRVLVDWINDRSHRWRRGNKDAILEVLKESEEYKKLQKEIQQESKKYWLILTIRRLSPPLLVLILVVAYLIIAKQQNLSDLILVLLPIVYTIVAEAIKQPE
jgi:deoxycytidine triphosphate deaminase